MMKKKKIMLVAFPPGYLLVATLELFHTRFLGCPSVGKEGSLSVLGVLFLQIYEKYVGALSRTDQNEPNSAKFDRT